MIQKAMSLMKQAAAGILAIKTMGNEMKNRVRNAYLMLFVCCVLGLLNACRQELTPQNATTATLSTSTTPTAAIPQTPTQEPSKNHNEYVESKLEPTLTLSQLPSSPTQNAPKDSIKDSAPSQAQNPTNTPNIKVLPQATQQGQEFVILQDSIMPKETLLLLESQVKLMTQNTTQSTIHNTYTQEMLENITGEQSDEQVEENGHIYNVQITYKNGTKIKHGKEILYYLDGQIAQKVFYVEGKREGLFQIFSQKGVLIYEAYYHNGVLHGPCRLFDITSGKIKSEMNFAYGLQEGQMNIYDATNGKLWHQLHYKQGKKEGRAVEFDESGRIVREVFYSQDMEIKR